MRDKRMELKLKPKLVSSDRKLTQRFWTDTTSDKMWTSKQQTGNIKPPSKFSFQHHAQEIMS